MCRLSHIYITSTFINLFYFSVLLQNMDTDEKAEEVFLKKSKNAVKITKNDKNNETPKKDFEKWELVPPDGGWGWLVLMGAMLVNILIPGTIKSFGVLFVEFLEAFEASPVTASWIPALCYFLYSSLGIYLI